MRNDWLEGTNKYVTRQVISVTSYRAHFIMLSAAAAIYELDCADVN
jgi:hypothetical protein